MIDPSAESVLRRLRTFLSAGALTGTLLTGCAVGPNFEAPKAPAASSYVPGALPEATRATAAPGGEAQHFASGEDIPGQWWTLFQSPQLNELIDRAFAHNPTLTAAQAALREANENLAAQRGSLYPTVTGSYQAERQKSSGSSSARPALTRAPWTSVVTEDRHWPSMP